VGYKDHYYEMMKFDKEEVNYKVPIIERVMKLPKNFKETDTVNSTMYQKVKDGSYTGTLKDNVPHGFGAIIFNKGVNHHPEMTHSLGHKMNTEKFLFYEGGFSGGSMNGQGVLLLQND